MTVLVLGGTGFLGRFLCAELRRQGAVVLSASRRGAGDLTVDLTASVNLTAELSEMMSGVDVVVNLVGLSPIRGYSRSEYLAVQYRGALAAAAAAAAAGVVRLVHVSALGVHRHSAAPYARSKALARRALLPPSAAPRPPQVIIPELALLTGHEGEIARSLRRLAGVARAFGFAIPVPLPRFSTLFQPVAVEDAARRIAGLALEGKGRDTVGVTVEIVGPRVLSMSAIAAEYLEAHNVPVFYLPRQFTPPLVWLLSRIPLPGFPRHLDEMLALRSTG